MIGPNLVNIHPVPSKVTVVSKNENRSWESLKTKDVRQTTEARAASKYIDSSPLQSKSCGGMIPWQEGRQLLLKS